MRSAKSGKGREEEGEGKPRKEEASESPSRLSLSSDPALLLRHVMAKGSFLLSKLDQRLFTTF